MEVESGPYIRFRLGNIDSYQASPTNLDRDDFAKVPIIRIWGAADETGQKVCCHVHGVYPYCYVEYTGKLTPDEVDAYIQKLHVSIDLSLAVAFKRNPHDPKSNAYVARITLCKGVPMYGFHVGWRFYLKIYMLNPAYMQRLADILRDGSIMGHSMQSYEVHIPYLLQFMADYGLYGCGWVECQTVTFRNPVPDDDDVEEGLAWNNSTIPDHLITSSEDKPRLSHCAIEMDLLSHHILNRRTIEPRLLHYDFIERRHPILPNRNLVYSMAELWRDEERRLEKKGDPQSFSSFYTSDPSLEGDVCEKGPWIHEAELRLKLEEKIHAEKAKNGSHILSFDTFVRPVKLQSLVQTALESVTDMFPSELPPSSQKEENYVGTNPSSGHLRDNCGDFPSAEVDERRIFALVNDIETNTSTPWIMKEGDYFSERSSESASEIDFDADLLGRGTEFLQKPSDYETAPSFGDRIFQPTNNVGVHDFSDNLDVDFDITSPTARNPPKSERVPNLLASQARFDQVDGKGDMIDGKDIHTLRLHGDAFAPRSKKRKSYVDSTLNSLNKRSKSGNPTNLRPRTGTSPQLAVQRIGSITSIGRNIRQSMQGKDFPVQSHLCLKQYLWHERPPSTHSILFSLKRFGIPRVIACSAYYGKNEDVPISTREYAGREFKLVSTSLPYLELFNSGENFAKSISKLTPETPCTHTRIWQIQQKAPSKTIVSDSPALGVADVISGFQSGHKSNGPLKTSQIDGVTQKHKYGFKFTQRRKTDSPEQELHYMSIMSIEVHVNTRGQLLPNPEEDGIKGLFWCIQTPHYASGIAENASRYQSGIITVKDAVPISRSSLPVGLKIDEEDSELDLINHLIDIVREYDPDILTGYEVQSSSWGYVIERARMHFEFDLCNELSRMKSMSHGRFGRENDRWGFTHASSIRVTGRHMINIWRAMRGELNLTQYTLENVAFHLLHRRVPHYSHADLTRWYQLPNTIKRLRILEAQELVARVCEQARVLGIDFYSVFSRGSQFKVESLMVRIAKAECFMLISPSRKQVGQQNALECIPLVMEPQSNFYPSPLLVLDFQSLYPSIIIAYNYCYSTCLGRVVPWKNQNKIGFTDLVLPERLLELLKDDINVAPNGLLFAKTSIRRAVVAKMLSEILDTRVMVKKSMSRDNTDKSFFKLQNNRQLALKFIANVTYGYISASFSGRMPCAEIADSIVQTGRETLEKAIEVIHSKAEWGAEVVYGDTDSLFVYLPGKTRDEAFEIGNDIAETITTMNPQPIKLKFEKIYHPCVLLAKKRYVGFKYEKRTDTAPVFDAKGIETVRRDGTPAQQKLEESALKLLFRTADLSLVKEYFQRQCFKILNNQVSIQDFCFAKEVKLGTYSENGVPPPGAIISARKMMDDPRAEPQYGERVPYVVKAGAPGTRLIDRVVSPEEMLKDKDMRLDAEYYISKTLIPPLERIFNLVGANVRSWYEDMPKVHDREQKESFNIEGLGRPTNTTTLHSFMRSRFCPVCRLVETDEEFCSSCRSSPSESIYLLSTRSQIVESRYLDLEAICSDCCGVPFGEEVCCDSRDCPVFYSRLKATAQLGRSVTNSRLLAAIEDAGNNASSWSFK